MAHYDIRKTAGGYSIINQVTGDEVVAIKGTREKAEKTMNRIIASEVPGKLSPGMRSSDARVPSYIDDTYTSRPITEAFVNGKRVGVTAPAAAPIDEATDAIASVSDGTSVGAEATAIPAFKFGGILKKVTGKVKDGGSAIKNAPGKAKAGVGKRIDALDDHIFGGEGLGSNLRKLKRLRDDDPSNDPKK